MQKFLNLLKGTGGKVLDAIALGRTIKPILKKLEKKNKRGPKPFYDKATLFKLVCEALLDGKKFATEIARYAKQLFVQLRYWVTRSPSHDVISDFLNELGPVIEQIFYKLVKIAVKLGLIKPYTAKIVDTLPIPTRFWSDPDAQWSKNPGHKKRRGQKHYWGYGGLLVTDAETHLPCAARLTYSKKVNAYACMEVVGKSYSMVRYDVLLGDSEFDMTGLIRYAQLSGILPVVQYNKRNTKQPLPIKFRTQMYTDSPYEWLDTAYRERVEVEHAIGTTGEKFSLGNPSVRGYDKVRTHFFLKLCLRLMHGIATFKAGLNPRQVTLL